MIQLHLSESKLEVINIVCIILSYDELQSFHVHYAAN